MPYSGAGADENDFAFDAIGAYIYLIVDRMMKDIKTVIKESYTEQSIIASLVCLRLLHERFPNNLDIHFGKKGFEAAKKSFEEWYDKVHKKLPLKWRNAIRVEAEKEFALFESQVFGK